MNENKDKEDPKRCKSRATLRTLCRSLLSAVNRTDQNSPVVLEKLSFNIFAHYMTTRKNRKGHLLSKSSYGGIRSALQHLHRANGTKMDGAMDKPLSEFMTKLYSGDGGDALFAHAFITLEWNLMARSDNVKSVQVSHIEWRHDCLVVFFGKSKGDQTGENDEPWHVYSNPLDPTICPVLSLAKYLIVHQDIVTSSGNLLFPGEEQYRRFIRIFNRTIADNKEEFASLGVIEGMLGSHSCRKGAITLVATGCTVSPSMAAICLRAGWSMGPVRDFLGLE